MSLLDAVLRGAPLEPPTPAILLSVTAGGLPSCLGLTETEARARDPKYRPFRVSPEFNERLMQEFPPGTTEDRLVTSLVGQGFGGVSPCEADSSIRSVEFNQHGGGMAVFRIGATVFWKVDSANTIIWTKGFVIYYGL